ncbi:ArsR/SmtB family transcription factor [candidate division KSB1 bacterium]
MDEKRRAQLEARAKILKTMAHPSRLFIIEELAKKECSVGELTDMIGVDISTVSKHLAVLKEQGIISAEKRGASVYYSLRCGCVLNFYDCVEDVIRENIAAQIELISE